MHYKKKFSDFGQSSKIRNETSKIQKELLQKEQDLNALKVKAEELDQKLEAKRKVVERREKRLKDIVEGENKSAQVKLETAAFSVSHTKSLKRKNNPTTPILPFCKSNS